MDFNQILSILLVLTSLSLGAFLGALRSKLLLLNDNNKLHNAFYGLSFVVLLFSIISAYIFKNDLLKPNWYGIVIFTVAIISSIILYWVTKNHLVKKYNYRTKELDPIINDFTKNADKNEIKLFGGDLNFFGNSVLEMNNNSQYTILRSLNFKKILILCENPNESSTKLRYGKIMAEMQNAELRFYNPEEADLRVRGRIIEVNGVSKLLMYTKNSPGYYKAIETDTANSNGALYNNIWDLVWSLANNPTSEQIQGYKTLFQGKD